MGKRRAKRRRGGEGCGYLLFACLVACLMLVVNAVVVRALYTVYMPQDKPRLGRAVLFVGPILLLVIQWAIVDRLTDLLGRSPDDDDS